MSGKERVGPPRIIVAIGVPADLLALAQHRAQSLSYLAVEAFEHIVITVFEVFVPSSDDRIYGLNNGCEASALAARGLLPNPAKDTPVSPSRSGISSLA